MMAKHQYSNISIRTPVLEHQYSFSHVPIGEQYLLSSLSAIVKLDCNEQCRFGFVDAIKARPYAGKHVAV
jgi:hypothetical protein